jgi:hypothetical protein
MLRKFNVKKIKIETGTMKTQISILSFLIFGFVAQAGVNARQRRQQNEIRQNSEQFTKKERRELRKSGKEINKVEAALRKDGLSDDDRKALDGLLDQRRAKIDEFIANDARPSREKRLEHHDKRQEHRIQDGIDDKQLTEAEVEKLSARSQEIENLETAAKADGVVDRSEYKAIRDLQHGSSHAIYELRQN